MASPRFANWESQNVRVADIELDDRNPRVTGNYAAQADIIRYLDQAGELYNLAAAFCTQGYYPTERIVLVTGTKYKYRVVEGNRRTAALKLLQNPDILDEGAKKYRTLRSRLDNKTLRFLREVPSIIAPSRDEANIIVADKHTTTPVEKWSRIQQARFYTNIMNMGYSFDDIMQFYNLARSNLANFIKISSMYDLVSKVLLRNECSLEIKDEKKIPITVLERLFDNQHFRDFAGVSLSNQGDLSYDENDSRLIIIVSTILRDMRDKRINTRNINSNEDVERYVNTINSLLFESRDNSKSQTDKNNSSCFQDSGAQSDASDMRNVGGAQSHAQGGAEQRGEQWSQGESSGREEPKSTKKRIVPTDVKCRSKNAKIRYIFEELQKIPLDRYPNAAAVLFRSFLELLLRQALYENGELENVSRKRNNPSLSEMMAYIGDGNSDLIGDKDLKKIAKRAVAHPEMMVSTESLNAYVHNQYYYTSEKEVVEHLTHYEPLIRYIMEECEI
ncbi:hypothetical protein SAMN05216241_104126 [Limimonas halophila]|uniref:ParB-like nuclease domain-containing protein n=1 Tax=Limimonas halophila TaxID=1082479 RepID=A0A1G7QU84_9PROT|nr:hypothetical protein [Limimonas halophila]SDG01429.1 hypothetical protein SAMN05216241_104126 [Limimonas halophila]